jgi:protein-S-isoprenylcysteine O-methyltransferase Ste14
VSKVRYKDWLFVGVQFFLLTIFFIDLMMISLPFILFLRYPGLLMCVLGFLVILIAILQLNKNLTPFPTPVESGKLIRTGLYKYARHPIYTGIFLAALGIAFFNNSLWQLSIAFILLILFYFKSRYEESMLVEKYEDYLDYRKATGRFFTI